MAIDLPEPVIDFLSAIGISWPDINEDHVRAFGQYVNGFIDSLQDIDTRASGTVNDVLQAYQGASSQRFSDVWTDLNSTYLQPALDLGKTLGGAAPVAADAIVGLKIAAIAQLVAMAVEFVADQVLAAVTFGLAEAALAAIEEAGVQAMKFLEQQREDLILSEIVEAAVTPLLAKVEDLVGGMVFGAVNAGADASLGSSVQLDPAQMDKLIQQFHGYGDEVVTAGQQFADNVQGLTFSEN
jgi:uncharacterized protein YukE